jgi:Carboxypeptidase regulatory-like domain/TonB-dependent Receptor Plug Domain
MNRSVFRLGLSVLLAAVFCAVSTAAYAQGSTSQALSGTVVDTSGAVIPGADVAAKHNATGVVSNAVSNSEGLFSIPSLPIGTYTVTVTLQGFKTGVIQNVVLTSGAGANVKVAMEVGGVAEQVTVSSSSEIVQTQSSGVSQTINTNQILKLPITSRSALDFVNMLPGVSTPSGNRQATINGLPRTAINITLDGINIQDNTLKGSNGGDGFFAIVIPRLDAIEEVTVSSAAQGADAAGQGAVQVKFVTRSGTNSFSGSGYEYYRRDRLNANTWFNNRDGVTKAKLKQDQYGFRVGGPIVVPGFDGHNKAFFFMNYEEVHQPSDTTRNRTILNPAAQAGNFNYAGGTINVLALAAANGQISTVDPTIAKVLSDIRSATATTGSIADTDGNLQRYTFNVPVESVRRYPTGRVDYNLTGKHRLTGSFNYQKFSDVPDTLNNRDPSFPGFPNASGQASSRMSYTGAMRSTLAGNLVNEARLGYSGAPVLFFPEMNIGMFKGDIANSNGFHLNFPTIGSALTNAGAAPAPQSRNATDLTAEDTITWLRGSHSFTMGGSFSQYAIWMKNSSLVPQITTGLITTDPANGLFTVANFPGASTANLTAAGNLYAFLTGRVSQISADARLDEGTGKYVYEGVGLQRGRLREFGGYAADQWRIRQNLTINAGVRWDVQNPFYPLNSSYTFGDMANICGVSGVSTDDRCNLFQSGVAPGIHPVYQQLTKGTRPYNVDYNNIAPSAGFAWTPQARPGFLGKVMGEGDFVLRAGYTRAFSRSGLSDFTGPLNANPGVVITTPVTRSEGNGNLLVGAAPLLFRSLTQLGPPTFSETPTYPILPLIAAGYGTQSINGFNQNIQVPYADSWQAGITRSLGKSMALEVRYVGTRGYEGWAVLNNNEFNIVENGFLKEFRQAQANLQANIAAGLLATRGFAYSGAPGTAPLPTFAAFFNGVSAANAGNSALYTGANWTNSTFLGFLAPLNPQPYNFANAGGNGLLGTAGFRGNATAAGVPVNFFVANPENLGGARVTTNVDKTKYDSVQVELRRRLSGGLQLQGSYVFGHGFNTVFTSFRNDLVVRRNAGDPGDITHQVKSNLVYELPFGRGRRWGGNANGIVDRIIGGWQLGAATKIQSGRLVDLGNVKLVGMSRDDVQKIFKLRFDDAGKQLYVFPKDVIDNTILAWNVSATSANGYAGAAPTGKYFAPVNGPDCIEIAQVNGANGGQTNANAGFGECGTGSLVLTGPTFMAHDIRISKRTTIVGRVNIEFATELLNAFNHPNFTPISGITNGSFGTTLTPYQLTGLTGTDTRRTIQFVGRVNW